MATVRLLGICGSLRKASLNRALLREIAAVLPAGATMDIDDAIGRLPLFDGDSKDDPQAVVELKAAIARADGVVFACPEYNYSITGALKNAIDWISRPPANAPLRNKPVGVVGGASGMSGTMRAQAHLRQILLWSNCPTLAQPEILIPRQHERFDAEGRLSDDSTRDLLRKFAGAMVDHVRRYQPQPS